MGIKRHSRAQVREQSDRWAKRRFREAKRRLGAFARRHPEEIRAQARDREEREGGAKEQEYGWPFNLPHNRLAEDSLPKIASETHGKEPARREREKRVWREEEEAAWEDDVQLHHRSRPHWS